MGSDALGNSPKKKGLIATRMPIAVTRLESYMYRETTLITIEARVRVPPNRHLMLPCKLYTLQFLAVHSTRTPLSRHRNGTTTRNLTVQQSTGTSVALSPYHPYHICIIQAYSTSTVPFVSVVR